jgi:hypothetical protein
MDREFIMIELGDFFAKFWVVGRFAESLESFSVEVFGPCIVGDAWIMGWLL